MPCDGCFVRLFVVARLLSICYQRELLTQFKITKREKKETMASEKIAVVTGGNKGIGYAIAKGLCEKFEGTVYLTARDTARGETTVADLKGQGHKPQFHQLDIDDQGSVDKFKDYLSKKYRGIDLLVNNAGIAFNVNATESFAEQAEVTVTTNYFGTLRVCEALFPLLRTNARVVNLSSGAGHLSRIPSADLRKKFSDSSLTVPELNELMNAFIKAAKEDPDCQKKWGSSTYAVSKVGVSALTRIQQREFDGEVPRGRNVQVNSVHPGFVATDMSNYKGHLSIEQGAVAPLFLAVEPHGLKGQFVWYDCSVVDWLSLPS